MADYFEVLTKPKLSCLSERLLHALKTLGISQRELARRLGITPQSINHLCSSKTVTSKFTFDIAESLGISGAWLANGEGLMLPEDDPQHRLLSSQKVLPLLNLDQIFLWLNDQNTFNTSSHTNWVISDSDLSKNGFGLILKDNSMAPKLDKGTIVIIDPNKEPKNKSHVLVYISSLNEILFRILNIEDNLRILCPLQTSLYKNITMTEEDKILGVIKEAKFVYD